MLNDVTKISGAEKEENSVLEVCRKETEGEKGNTATVPVMCLRSGACMWIWLSPLLPSQEGYEREGKQE